MNFRLFSMMCSDRFEHKAGEAESGMSFRATQLSRIPDCATSEMSISEDIRVKNDTPSIDT